MSSGVRALLSIFAALMLVLGAQATPATAGGSDGSRIQKLASDGTFLEKSTTDGTFVASRGSHGSGVHGSGVSRIATGRRTGSTAYHRCGSFTFTPHSDDALLYVRTRGIGCRAARRVLRAWHDNGYLPRSGPAGYRCKVISEETSGFRRTSCHRKHRRIPTISFNSGP